MRLRAGIFSQVENFSMQEINRFSTASLITRTTNDVTQIQMLVAMGLQVIIKAPIMAVWAICKIQSKSWQWTTATFCAVLFMLVLILIAVTFAMPRFKRIQTLTDNLKLPARKISYRSGGWSGPTMPRTTRRRNSRQPMTSSPPTT